MSSKEYLALLTSYGEVQTRCSRLVSEQRHEAGWRKAELMRARAEAIMRDSALAMLREDLATLKAALPGLPKRVELVRQLALQRTRIAQLQREYAELRRQTESRALPNEHMEPSVLQSDGHQKAVVHIDQRATNAVLTHRVVEMADGQFMRLDGNDASDSTALEENLSAADLVICQTGCISHGAYWRVQDYCKRTGKQCFLVEQSDALHIVSVHGQQAEAFVSGTPHVMREST